MSREKRGVDDVISEKSHYMTVRKRDGRRNKFEKYCRMIYSGAWRRGNDIYMFYISNFSPAALIHLNCIFIPFWQILTFLQIQLLLSSYFSSHSPCALSLSLSVLSCLLALQHTLVASLSLSIPVLYLFILVYLFQSYCFSQFPSFKIL